MSSSPIAPAGITLADDELGDGAYFLGAGAFSAPAPAVAPSTATVPSTIAHVPTPTPAPASASAASALPRPQWTSVVRSNAPPPATAPTPAGSLASPARATSAPDGAPLCSFFARGSCRNGDRCRFRHAAPVEPWALQFFQAQVSASRGIADNAAQPAGGGAGAPAAGEAPDYEDDTDAFAAAGAVWRSSLGSRSALLESAVAAGVCASLDEAEAALHAAERAVSVDVECSVCLEVVLASPGRRFGLLSGCTHAFCLDCIRTWRARIDVPKSTARACPVCRRLSFFVIGADRYIADEASKAALSEDYSRATKTIPCKHFNYGRGECPFGTSCFYAHLNFDGTVAQSSGAHGFRLSADGTVSGAGGKKSTLSDFLFND